jgi:hypothetical protein
MIERETQLKSGLPIKAERRARSHDRWEVPVLRARDGGPAERLARSFGALHPALVFIVTMLACLAVIAAASIGLGLLVTHVLEHAWGIGAANERVDVWLAAHRTSSRTRASLIGSIAAGGVVLPIVAGSVAPFCGSGGSRCSRSLRWPSSRRPTARRHL